VCEQIANIRIYRLCAGTAKLRLWKAATSQCDRFQTTFSRRNDVIRRIADYHGLARPGAGYNVYVVEDCCGATSKAAQDAAVSRMAQAGAIRLTTIATLLEWQRDWKDKEHYDALMGILKEHAGAYGSGIEYAYTMVHDAPQTAKKPQSLSHASRGMSRV
jgi:Isochorismatase family